MHIKAAGAAARRAAREEVHREPDAREVVQALERRLQALARVLGVVAEDAARNDVVPGVVGNEGERVAHHELGAASEAGATALDHRLADVEAGVGGVTSGAGAPAGEK